MLDVGLDEAVSRVINRVLDCLPVKDTLNYRQKKLSPTISGGVGIGSYYRSPVGPFPVYDTLLSYEHPLSENLDWWTSFQLSTTGRDRSEHLRNSITSVSLAFGPRPTFQLLRLDTKIFVVPWIERRGFSKAHNESRMQILFTHTPTSAGTVQLRHRHRVLSVGLEHGTAVGYES